jgi:hypothetical protein
MNRRKLLVPVLITASGLAVVVGSMAIAEPVKDAPSRADAKPAGGQEMKLPPGWTEEDMKACVLAGTPGKMHKHLASGAGVWKGGTTMWMAPEAEPAKSECTSTVTPMMDGRYIKVEITGDMPGMGPFSGFGLYGFDNVSEKFVSAWIDNQSTGVLNGVGELSSDGKTLTWKVTYNCPITKKPAVMREVETITGPDTRTLEMFGSDPKSGKEFKMMRIEFTKKSGVPKET